MSRHRSRILAINRFNEGVRRDVAEMPPTDDPMEKPC